MTRLAIKSATKVFSNNFAALRDVNISLNQKEFLVILGPSGCGKTTLLRCVAGLESLTNGEIFIQDRDVTTAAPKDRNVAMVFQNYALYPHMSVYNNMAFALKGKFPEQDIRVKIQEVSRVLGIDSLLDRKPSTLSGGQKQRVALGRAMVRNPDVFLMDEPLSNLDALTRSKTRIELIHLYQKLDATFVYVTHDQEEAMTMGTVIVVMSDGEVQQIGSPQEIYDYPRNIFVAKFIGNPQINLFVCEIVQDSDVFILRNPVFSISVNSKSPIAAYLFANPDVSSIQVGVRCETISLMPDERIDECVFQATVTSCTRTGREAVVYLEQNGVSFAALSPSSHEYSVGDIVSFRLQEEKLLFFDGKTGERIAAE